MASPVVVIPARLSATRLPDKPLADIAGLPMIVHVVRRAQAAAIGPVVVATDSPAIAEAVEAAGGRAVLTRADHPSGSDRVFEALSIVDPQGRHDIVVNVQGDLPTIDPAAIVSALAPLEDAAVDIATLAAVITRDEERTSPDVVKVVGSPVADNSVADRPVTMRAGARLRALYFTRAPAPWGEGDLLHHIGLYAYRRPALARFVSLAPSPLERREKLEQLRALEDGMRIDVAVVDDVPLGVDTPADLARARAILTGIEPA